MCSSDLSNDIERATQLAHNMVCNWGMSEALGPINYKKSAMSPFGSNEEAIDFSDKTSQEIDKEVTRLVKSNHQLATDILVKNREALDRLAEGLILWETLDFAQVKDLVEGRDIGSPIVHTDEPDSKSEKLDSSSEENADSSTDESVSDNSSEDPQTTSKNNSDDPVTA